MKPGLAPGISTTRRQCVDDARAIRFMGEDCRVYATPAIINDLEYACRDLLLEHLDAGEDSVGTKVNVEHLSAALYGDEVEIAVAVAKVEGRRITFEAKVSDRDGIVLAGTHERFVVDTGKTRERLLGKLAKR